MNLFTGHEHWRIARAGGRVPQTLFTGNCILTYREKRDNDKSENGEEKVNLKRKEGKVGNLE